MSKLWKSRLTLFIAFYLCIWKFYQNLQMFEREEALLNSVLSHRWQTVCTSFLTAKEMGVSAAPYDTLVGNSVWFSCSVMSDSLRPHGLQHARPPCPSSTPGVYPNSCPVSQWCRPTISSSVVPFSSCPQSFPASGSFRMSQLFTSDGQSIGVSASTSVLPVNTQDWSPLEWTSWISLQSKGLYGSQ